MTTEQLKDLIRSVGYTTQAQSMEIALSIEEALLAENTALAAGQCIHDDGLTADEGGTPYCAKEKRIAELEATIATLNKALAMTSAGNKKLEAALDVAQGALEVILRDYAAVHDIGDLEMQPAIYQAHAAIEKLKGVRNGK